MSVFRPLLLALLVVTCGVTRGQVRDPMDDERVRPLVLANERTRDRLPSFACDLAITVNDTVRPDGAEKLELVFRAKGSARYVAGKPGSGQMDRAMRVVRNDAYTAVWTAGVGPVNQDERHEGTSPPDARVVAAAGAHADRLLRYDPLLAAFGDGTQPLRQALVGYRPTGYDVSDVADASGRRVVRLRVFTKEMPGPTHAAFDYDFDAARGYVVTRSAWNYGARAPAMERRVEYQAAGGAWVPRRVLQLTTHYNMDPMPASDIEVRLRSVGDLSDMDFRLAALDLPEGAQIMRRTAGGQLQLLARYDGVWLPMNLAFRFSLPTTAPAGVGAPAGGSVWEVWVSGLGLALVGAVRWWTVRRIK